MGQAPLPPLRRPVAARAPRPLREVPRRHAARSAGRAARSRLRLRGRRSLAGAARADGLRGADRRGAQGRPGPARSRPAAPASGRRGVRRAGAAQPRPDRHPAHGPVGRRRRRQRLPRRGAVPAAARPAACRGGVHDAAVLHALWDDLVVLLRAGVRAGRIVTTLARRPRTSVRAARAGSTRTTSTGAPSCRAGSAGRPSRTRRSPPAGCSGARSARPSGPSSSSLSAPTYAARCLAVSVGFFAATMSAGGPSKTTVPPSWPGAGTDVDDPVGVGHHGLVVLDDDDRLAGVDEAVEQAEEVLHVGEVQAGGGLVEDVDVALLPHLRRELEPLALAAGQGGQRLAERRGSPGPRRRAGRGSSPRRGSSPPRR